MNQAHPLTSSTSADPSKTQTVAVVAAVRDELRPTVAQLKLKPDQPWFVGTCGKVNVVAAFTGVGSPRAIEVLATMLDEYRPEHVIHMGFAGGLDPAIQVGTVLDVQWVLDGQGHAVRLDNQRPQLVKDDPTQRPPGQTLLTMNHLVHSVAVKRDLFMRHRASAVDMETFYVASLVAQRGIRMTMLRAISDPAHMPIPSQAGSWVKPDGTDNIPTAIWHLVTHPWLIPQTVRLGRNAKLAGRNLARSVQSCLNGQL